MSEIWDSGYNAFDLAVLKVILGSFDSLDILKKIRFPNTGSSTLSFFFQSHFLYVFPVTVDTIAIYWNLNIYNLDKKKLT